MQWRAWQRRWSRSYNAWLESTKRVIHIEKHIFDQPGQVTTETASDDRETSSVSLVIWISVAAAVISMMGRVSGRGLRPSLLCFLFRDPGGRPIGLVTLYIHGTARSSQLSQTAPPEQRVLVSWQASQAIRNLGCWETRGPSCSAAIVAVSKLRLLTPQATYSYYPFMELVYGI